MQIALILSIIFAAVDKNDLLSLSKINSDSKKDIEWVRSNAYTLKKEYYLVPLYNNLVKHGDGPFHVSLLLQVSQMKSIDQIASQVFNQVKKDDIPFYGLGGEQHDFYYYLSDLIPAMNPTIALEYLSELILLNWKRNDLMRTLYLSQFSQVVRNGRQYISSDRHTYTMNKRRFTDDDIRIEKSEYIELFYNNICKVIVSKNMTINTLNNVHLIWKNYNQKNTQLFYDAVLQGIDKQDDEKLLEKMIQLILENQVDVGKRKLLIKTLENHKNEKVKKAILKLQDQK